MAKASRNFGLGEAKSPGLRITKVDFALSIAWRMIYVPSLVTQAVSQTGKGVMFKLSVVTKTCYYNIAFGTIP